MKQLGLLAVRAHSGPTGGYGHAMRCKAIAQEWAERGGSVVLLTDKFSSVAVSNDWTRSGFSIRNLSVEPGSSEDIVQTTDRACDADFIVLDGYYFDSRFQLSISNCARVVCIDDNAEASPYSADIVLSQDIGYDGPVRLCSTGSTEWVLSGPKYILLRSEFKRWIAKERLVSKDPVRVLMTVGGSNTDLLRTFLRVADNINRYFHDVHVVVMASSECLNRLHVDIESYEAEIARDVDDVAALMSNIDFAVSGGGTTLLELAFMGIPTWAVEVAASQRPMMAELARREVITIIPHGYDYQELLRIVAGFSPYRGSRCPVNHVGRQLIDGGGARRVVDVMKEHLGW